MVIDTNIKPKKSITVHSIAVFLIFISFLTLHKYTMSVIVFEFRIDYVFVILYFFFYIKQYERHYFNNKFIRKVIYIFFFLALWNILSVITGMFFTEQPTHIADLTMSFKYLFMAMYFALGGILTLSMRKINFTLIVQVLSLFMIIIGLLEYFNPGFSSLLKAFYRIDDKETAMVFYRIVGTVKNSNNVALIATLFILLNLYIKENQFIKVLITTGLIIIILLTGSRTGTVMMIVVLVQFFLSYYLSFRNVVIVFMVLIGVVLTATYFINFEDTVLFSRVLSTEIDEMFLNRKIFYWNKTLKVIAESPVLGVGLLVKGGWTVDSFYLNLIKTNGIIGLIIYVYFLLITASLALSNYRKTDDAKILLGIIIIIIVGSVSADFFLSNIIFPIFFILIGIYAHILINNNIIENSRSYTSIV